MAFDLKKVMGVGTDDMEASLGLPFLQIVQKGSPEFDESHPKHAEKKITGCKPGDIILLQQRKLLGQPIRVVPVATATLYTEWKPRTKGGGFVGNQPLTITGTPAYRKGRQGTPDENKEWLGENELKLTTYFSLLFEHGTEWLPGLISFTSTQLKHARRWSREIQNLRYPEMPDEQPAIFAASWFISTENDSNEKGGWKCWSIKFDHLLDPVKEQALLEQSFTAYGVESPRLNAPTQQKQLGGGEPKDVAY